MIRILVVAVVLAIAISACGGARPEYDQALEALGPFPVQGGVAFLNRTLGELLRLRLVAPGQIQVDRLALRAAPRSLLSIAGGGQLAILHDDPDRPGISLVHAGTWQLERFLPLAEAYDSLSLAPDLLHAVASFGSAAQADHGILNLNQVQVVDFSAGVARAPVALQTGGLNPRGVQFLPPGAPGFESVAVIVVDNGLVLLDLIDPVVDPLWVRFTSSPGGVAVPAQVVAGPFSAAGGTLYVRLVGGREVYSVQVTRDLGQLRRTINFLNVPPHSRPTDLLVLPGQAFADKVLAVFTPDLAGTASQAALLDANAIQTDERIFELAPGLDRAIPLIGQGAEGPRVLAAAFRLTSSPGATPATLDVLDPATGQQEAVLVQDLFDRVSGPEDGSALVLFHGQLGQSGGPGLRVLRMEQNASSGRWSPRVSTFSLTAVLSGDAFDRDLLFGALAGEEPGVFWLDLGSGETQVTWLDRPAVAMGRIPGAQATFFQHHHPLGSLTLVPDQPFDRRGAALAEGFLLKGLLDP